MLSGFGGGDGGQKGINKYGYFLNWHGKMLEYK